MGFSVSGLKLSIDSAGVEVTGQIKINGGSPGAGKVLTSDATGLASWTNATALDDGDWTISGNDLTAAVSGQVGIGTSTPAAKLHVRDGVSGATAVAGHSLILEDDSSGVGASFLSIANNTGTIAFLEPGENFGGRISYGQLNQEFRLIVSTGPNSGTTRFAADPNRVWLGSPLGVGIALNATPAQELQVNGDIQADSFIDDNNTAYFLNPAASGTAAVLNGHVSINTTSPDAELHIEGGTDASLTGGGYIVTGDPAALNLVIDNNEIMARNNNVTSGLFLQNDGGDLKIGGPTIIEGDTLSLTISNTAESEAGIIFRDTAGGAQTYSILFDAVTTNLNFHDGNDLQARFRQDASAQNDSGWVTASVDYAEFMELLDPTEEVAIFDVVAVKDNKITRDTQGATLLMVTATDSGLRGGNPLIDGYSRDEDPDWRAVAFIGQMPVLVDGDVSEGDYIVPSGRNDGRAVAVAPAWITRAQFDQVIGRALESSASPMYQSVDTTVDPETSAHGSEMLEELARLQARRGTAHIINVAVGLHNGLPTFADETGEIDRLRRRLTETRQAVESLTRQVSAFADDVAPRRIIADQQQQIDELKALVGMLVGERAGVAVVAELE